MTDDTEQLTEHLTAKFSNRAQRKDSTAVGEPRDQQCRPAVLSPYKYQQTPWTKTKHLPRPQGSLHGTRSALTVGFDVKQTHSPSVILLL